MARSEEKILSLYYGSGSACVDAYMNRGIKTTLISGRNLPDISTVVGRAVTPSTREGAGRPRPASPTMPASWHYALRARGFVQPPGCLSCPVEYEALRPAE